MDALTDDGLVAVLQHLRVVDLSRARLVCRRWRDLVQHPDVWRQRSFSYSWSAKQTAFALLLAPCAATFVLDGDFEDLGAVVASTACAVTTLEVELTESNAILAALAIRNQAALGRLRILIVLLDLPGEDATEDRLVEGLLAEVHAVRGLTQLTVDLALEAIKLPPAVSDVVPSELIPASLEECSFLMWASLPPITHTHWEFQLSSHAATLRKVVLLGLFWPSLRASLFNAMPVLEELACPLLDDMHLLRCGQLRTLALDPVLYSGPTAADDERFNAAVEKAQVFFRGATDLQKLDLMTWECGFGRPAATMVGALASTGRAQLQVVYISCQAAEQPRLLGLPGLPGLCKIKFSSKKDFSEIPDAFVHYLAEQSLPSVTVVRGALESCFQRLLQPPLLRAVWLKNPQLHLLTVHTPDSDKGELCRGDRGCNVQCAMSVAVCGHPEAGDGDCSVSKYHSKWKYRSEAEGKWVRVPPHDAE